MAVAPMIDSAILRARSNDAPLRTGDAESLLPRAPIPWAARAECIQVLQAVCEAGVGHQRDVEHDSSVHRDAPQGVSASAA